MSGAARLSLPRWPHRPGRTPAADAAPLLEAKRRLPPRFEGAVPADDPVFRYGLALHDNGFFWEAHEVWEAVWKAAPMNGRDRLALRALIQIANAGLKAALGQPGAVARLVAEALALLDEVERRGAGGGSAVADRLDGAALRGRLLRLGAEGQGAHPHLTPLVP